MPIPDKQKLDRSYYSDDMVSLYKGDCVSILPSIPSNSINSVITDPPYPEIDRPYGRMTESEWFEMMYYVVHECRRILKPTGSAVFILQPNYERLGKMRGWLWKFMGWVTDEFGMVQDMYWWNPSILPAAGTHREIGLARQSVKLCVWLGDENCYRNQDEVLWKSSDQHAARDREDRAFHRRPSGHSTIDGRMAAASQDRGGTTPFNLIPISSNGEEGHPASTPLKLCDWWTRYITPIGGTILDPFAGSGTTGVSALKHGCKYIGIERDEGYIEIAKNRLQPISEEAHTNRVNAIKRNKESLWE